MATIGSLNIILSTSTASFNSGIAQAQKSLKAFVGSTTSLRPALSALGVGLGIGGLVLGLKKLVTTGADFEHQMQAVKAITGASGADFEALSKEAARLGASTQFTAKQAAAGMEVLGQAGLETNTILLAMEPTLNLAAAGAIDIAQAAEVTVTAMTGMGIAADRLQETVDILAKASSASNTDVLGLGEALKVVGPISHTAGKGLTEVVSAVETLSNAGIKGEEAGTALRQILIKLADQTPEAEHALKSLGVKTTDAAGNIRPLADIVDDFAKSLNGLGSGDKIAKLSKIFEARAAGSFAALIEQGGDALRKFERELGGATGEAARQAETRMDSLSGSWEKFTSAVDGLSITISQGTSGGLRSIVDFATSAVDWFNTMWTTIDATAGAFLGMIWDTVSSGWSAVFDVTSVLFTGVFNTVGGTMHDITDMIVTGLAMAEYSFTHWRDIAAIAGLSVAAGVVTIGNQIAYVFTEVIPKTLDWLAGNWREVFYTMFDFTATVFINLGKNIRNAMSEIWDYIKSAGADKLEFTWTPLKEGFVNTIRELPEIGEREIGQLEAAMYEDLKTREEALGKGLDDFTKQRLTEFHIREALAGMKPDVKAPDVKMKTPDLEGKAPAGIGESKKNAALELGTAAAFHASFGGKSDSQTFQQMLKNLMKSQRDTERIRLLQEKNNVKPAAFGFGGGGGGF